MFVFCRSGIKSLKELKTVAVKNSNNYDLKELFKSNVFEDSEDSMTCNVSFFTILFHNLLDFCFDIYFLKKSFLQKSISVILPRMFKKLKCVCSLSLLIT